VFCKNDCRNFICFSYDSSTVGDSRALQPKTIEALATVFTDQNYWAAPRKCHAKANHKNAEALIEYEKAWKGFVSLKT
jgi:N-acetylmuramoyl-L-alanine amidase CwlA